LKSKAGVRARLESDLPFWQIYNPPERRTIAVEPASFSGNLYHIHSLDPLIELPKTGRLTFSVYSA
jgi:hypothetical protein